jgi:hypothetical protein
MDPRTTQISTADGIIIARSPAEVLATDIDATAEQMQCRRDDRRFGALSAAAAAACLQHGYPLAQLTPLAAEERRLLPDNWVNEEDSGTITKTGLELGQWQGSDDRRSPYGGLLRRVACR